MNDKGGIRSQKGHPNAAVKSARLQFARPEQSGQPVESPLPVHESPCQSRPVKPAQTSQTGAAGQAAGRIACKYFKMNGLQNNQPAGGSDTVKLNQTESNQFRGRDEPILRHFFEKAADQTNPRLEL
jgi:hypothetical protein